MSVRSSVAIGSLLLFSMTALAADSPPSTKPSSTKPSSAKASSAKAASIKSNRIKRGEYLVMIGSCHDCHTPKLDEKMTLDTKRTLSGRPVTTAAPAQAMTEVRGALDLTAWSGPWGISYAANLTPDPTTGIGKRYDQAKFIKALRTGIKPEGEPILPPMPWPMIGKMTDEDLKSVFAYLMSLPPVKNNVKASPVVAAK